MNKTSRQMELHEAYDMFMPPQTEVTQYLNENVVKTMHMFVLEQTLEDLSSKKLNSSSRKEMMEWLLSDVIAPFSFSICAVLLGCNPQKLRRHTLRVLGDQNVY